MSCIENLDRIRSLKEIILSVQSQFQELIQAIQESIIEDQDDLSDVIVIEEDESSITEEPSYAEGFSWEREKLELEKEMITMKLLSCHICMEECATYKDLQEHFEQVHNEPVYVFCCNQKFSDMVVHYHLNQHKKPSEQPSQDDKPTRNSQRERKKSPRDPDAIRSPVRSRSRKNEPESARTCETCARVFSSVSVLEKHKITHVPIDLRELPFTCHICAKSFGNQANLNQHLKTHDRTVSQPCPICEKHVFDVKRHIKQSHGEKKKYTCNICGQQVFRLGKHIKYHHPEQDVRFTCEYCEKSFKTKAQLGRHVNIHTGVKEACPFCSHKSSTRGNLFMHMKSLHPDLYEDYRQQRLKQPKVKVF